MLELLAKLTLRVGRRGANGLLLAGFVSGVSGAALLWATWPSNFNLAALSLGAAPMLLGAGLLARGHQPRRRSLNDGSLRALLESGRSTRLCLDCRLEFEAARCPSCGNSTATFDVHSDADRQHARALLGLSP